jgi:hypothetical protein
VLWLVLDIAIPLVAIALMVRGGLVLWRRTKVLTKRLGEASDAVAVANDALAAAQAAAPRRR